jgi:hypothetical protein
VEIFEWSNYGNKNKMKDKWDPQVAKDIKQLEFDRRIELLTNSIVNRIKSEVRLNTSNKKRHKQ